MSIFWYLGFFVLALAVLIVVHELGHFSVARLCGVKVLRFSVGFGRPLWMRRFGPDQTEWSIGAFPLGGYVRMLDEHEGKVDPSEVHRAFNRQSVGKRIAIVAAGPLANFLLAIAVFWGVFLHGVDEIMPVLDAPPAGSVAARAGVERGDTVVRVAGVDVATLQGMRWQILNRVIDSRDVSLEVLRADGQAASLSIDLSGVNREKLEGDIAGQLGLIAARPRVPPVIGSVVPGGLAAQAGLTVGDRVTLVNGEQVSYWSDVVTAIRANAGRRLQLDVDRAGVTIQISVIPVEVDEAGQKIGRIGIGPKLEGQGPRSNVVTVRYGILDAFAKALDTTWETTRLTLSVMGRMVTGDVSWRNLSGPVAIADYAGQSAAMGVMTYVRFIALVSISVGVLNLLPIPVLDGGHLVYYLAEILRGRPVSERAVQWGQKVGLALLLMLTAFAFYNDINRLFSG